MEEVDVLAPPMFEPNGEVMTATQAILSGRWLGSANVWVYRQNNGQLEFLYQEREPNSPWMPGKLDVAAGGYYNKGECATPQTRRQGALRELTEELGLRVASERLQHLTRRLNVGISQKGNERKSCCDIYSLEVTNNDAIQIDGVEVVAICWIKLQDIMRLHQHPSETMTLTRAAVHGQTSDKTISAADFVVNYDDFLFTMPPVVAALHERANQ